MNYLIAISALLGLVAFYFNIIKPVYNEKALKKEEIQRASIKATVAAMHYTPEGDKESIWLNDSGVHNDWGEGPESIEELK